MFVSRNNQGDYVDQRIRKNETCPFVSRSRGQIGISMLRCESSFFLDVRYPRVFVFNPFEFGEWDRSLSLFGRTLRPRCGRGRTEIGFLSPSTRACLLSVLSQAICYPIHGLAINYIDLYRLRVVNDGSASQTRWRFMVVLFLPFLIPLCAALSLFLSSIRFRFSLWSENLKKSELHALRRNT